MPSGGRLWMATVCATALASAALAGVPREPTSSKSTADQITKTLAQMSADHPGDAYAVTLIDDAPDPRPAATALYLPRSGDGTWQLDMDGRLFDAALTTLVWTGNKVAGRAKMGRLGNYDFAATVEESTGSFEGSLSKEGKLFARLRGARVAPAGNR